MSATKTTISKLKATIINRVNGKSCKIILSVTDSGLVSCNKSQWDNMQKKLGKGPKETDVSFIAYKQNGYGQTVPYEMLDAPLIAD